MKKGIDIHKLASECTAIYFTRYYKPVWSRRRQRRREECMTRQFEDYITRIAQIEKDIPTAEQIVADYSDGLLELLSAFIED